MIHLASKQTELTTAAQREFRRLDAGEFYERIAEAAYSGRLVCHITDRLNLEFVRQTTGIDLRKYQADLAPGADDQLLILALTTSDPVPTGELIPARFFDFFHAMPAHTTQKQ